MDIRMYLNIYVHFFLKKKNITVIKFFLIFYYVLKVSHVRTVYESRFHASEMIGEISIQEKEASFFYKSLNAVFYIWTFLYEPVKKSYTNLKKNIKIITQIKKNY